MEKLKIAQLASGHLSLLLTDRVGWEGFEDYPLSSCIASTADW